MSYFKKFRQSGTSPEFVKELAEKLARINAETGIEDISLLRQMRVDTDAITYTDAEDNQLDGDRNDTDSIAYTDAETNTLQNSGAFQVCNPDGSGTTNSQPIIVGFFDIGNARGTGDAV